MIHLVRLDKSQEAAGDRLAEVLKHALPGREYRRIKTVSEFLLASLTGEMKEIVFALSIPENGYAPEWFDLIGCLLERPGRLKDMKAVVIVDGKGSMFTKSIGRELIFAANYAGCAFPGKPLVEATGSLYNFNTSAAVKGVDNLTAYKESVSELLDRLEDLRMGKTVKDTEGRQRVLAIHSGNRETSNSLALLDMVKSNFGDNVDYKEISVRNGEIVDCRGCGFDTCKHFGESGECFYGGVMVEQVYPAILECDSLILVCPNYNDSIGANMLAIINRLTALFYNNSFANKKIYAIIVSGYSGGELLAEQIIGAMNCNKGFVLPPNFALLETANNPGDMKKIPGIEERARDFADSVSKVY